MFFRWISKGLPLQDKGTPKHILEVEKRYRFKAKKKFDNFILVIKKDIKSRSGIESKLLIGCTKPKNLLAKRKNKVHNDNKLK